MGLELRPPVIRSGHRLDAGDLHFLLIVEDLGQDLALLVLVENHLAVGGHADLEEGIPAHIVGLLVRHDTMLRVVNAHQGEEGQKGGVVTETQVGGTVAAGLDGGVRLIDEVLKERTDGIADDVAVLDGAAPHAVDIVIAAGPEIDQLLGGEIFPVDVDAEEVDDLTETSGGIDRADEALGVAEGGEGGVIILEQRGQEALEIIAGSSRGGSKRAGRCRSGIAGRSLGAAPGLRTLRLGLM